MLSTYSPNVSIGSRVPLTNFYSALPKQLEFHKNPARFRAMVGGYGSGKTLALLMEAIICCLTVPGCNALIIRRTYHDLEQTVINKFEDTKLVPRHLYASYNKNKGKVTFHNGSTLFFGYCQHDRDVAQYLSTEFAFIGIEEAGEFSFHVFESLAGRARTSTEIVDLQGNPIKPSVGLSTNPYGPGYHWIKTLFGTVKKDFKDRKPMEDTDPKAYDPNEYFCVHSTVFDNPFTCTPTYIKTLEGLTGAKREKALYGNMDLVSGQYFDNFDTEIGGRHVKRWGEVTFRSYHPKWMSADWGMAHSFPVYWFTKGEIKDEINGGTRVVNVVYREHIMREMNAIEAADDIARMCDHDDKGKITEKIANFYLSWDRFMRQGRAQGFDHSIAEQMGDRMKKFGLPRPQPADKNRVDGWALIYQLLDMDQLVFMENCEKAIAQLPLLTRDETNLEDVQKSDTLADDVGDALRYGLKSYLKGGKVPEPVTFQQKLDAAPDLQVKYLMGLERRAKQEKAGRAQHDRRILPWQIE